MKKNYLIFSLLFSATLFAQTSIFNNGGGDNLWSNTANWDTKPSDGGNTAATLNADVTLDESPTFLTRMTCNSSTLTATGGNGITIVGSETIAILSGGSGTFTYNAPITFDASGSSNIQVNSTGAITFDTASSVTLSQSVIAVGSDDAARVNFLGTLLGSANLNVRTDVVFGEAADNSAYTGNFILQGGAIIESNTTVDGGFTASGTRLQTNSASTVTINGANSFDGPITTINSLALNINADQLSVGNVTLGASIMTLTISNGSNIYFADSSSRTWDAGGEISIVGFVPGTIRFGTDAAGLTAQQLSLITADGAATGNALELDASGFLVVGPALSNDEFAESQKRISYPTLVENNIYFSKPKNDIQIYNVMGKKVFEVFDKNAINNLAIPQLGTGLYFIVFDGIKTEKFLKK